jgi:hypothetical protein
MFLTGISIGILEFGGLPERRPADAIARANRDQRYVDRLEWPMREAIC